IFIFSISIIKSSASNSIEWLAIAELYTVSSRSIFNKALTLYCPVFISSIIAILLKQLVISPQ
ncbi:hypothetical protein MUP95_01560, partial [bacterium]|nr:hypothetical protein [bacterium]